MVPTCFIAAAFFTVALAAEEDWIRTDKMVVVSERLMFEGTAKTYEDCLDEAAKLSQDAFQYHEETNVCTVYHGAVNSTALVGATGSFSYSYRKPEEGESLSAGEIIATVVMSILFGLCLIFLAFNCKAEHVDISDQMERLEKKELEKEEAASEEWERKSQLEEEMAEKEAAQ